MYATLPIKWAFGDTPSDGFSGEQVKDAGTLYIVQEGNEKLHSIGSLNSAVCLKFTLASIVDEVLNGAVQEGVLAEKYGDSLIKLKASFDAEAAKIDAVLKTNPKFFIQKL
jgi:hypothetical protein